MKTYQSKYRVVKKGRKWIHLLSVPENWKAELLLDETTQRFNENDVISGVFQILKDFPRQIKFLPDVSEQDLEEQKNLSEFHRWLGYCQDAVKKGDTYQNGIEKAEAFLSRLKTTEKAPLQQMLNEVKEKMKAIKLERQRQNDLEKFKQYVKYVKNHDGYYANGFAVLEEIIRKWGLDEYREEVKMLKQEALKRELLLQIERSRSVERIDQLIEKLDSENDSDILKRARKKKAEVIKTELERQFERFSQNHLYDLELKTRVQNMLKIMSDVEDEFTEEDAQYLNDLIDQFSAVYDHYVKLPNTEFIPDVIRKKLKELCRAKFEPSEAKWYVPIEKYNEAESLLAKRSVSMDDIYEIAKKEFEPDSALTFDELFGQLPRAYNWLKRQYVMVTHSGGEREYVGKRVDFTRSRKNATIAYSEQDKKTIQASRFLQYRDGSHKHLTTYLFIQVEGKWYLLIKTEENLWNELLKRFVV